MYRRHHDGCGGTKVREIFVVLALLMTAGTGCIGSESTGAADQAAPTGTNATVTASNATEVPQVLRYERCADQTAIYPVPIDAVRREVPEGFDPVPLDPAGVNGILVMPAYTCKTSDGETVSELWAFVLVEPPEAWADPDATIGHLIPLGGTTTSEASAGTYHAWGFTDPLETGEVTAQITETPAGIAARFDAQGSDSGVSITQVSVAVGEAETASAGSARVFAVQDTEVTGAMDVSWPEHRYVPQGEATLQETPSLVPFTPPAWTGIVEQHLPSGHSLTLEPVDLPPRAA